MKLNTSSTDCRIGRVAGFTLVELMVAIALVLVLMLGVNVIFRTTGDTAGAGQTISAMNRDFRAADTVFRNDFNAAVPMASTPCLVLRCGLVQAFTSADDKLSNGANSAMPWLATDLPGYSVGNNFYNIYLPYTNRRNHRTDTFSFFARGAFQAADYDGPPPGATTWGSPEAWIWYGHVAQPDNTHLNQPDTTTVFYGPGDPSNGTTNNDNNCYSNQWILGRMPVLLQPDAATISPSAIYLQRVTGAMANWRASPLGCYSRSTDGYNILFSQHDLANTSVATFGSDVGAYITWCTSNPPLATKLWWYNLTYSPLVYNPFTDVPPPPLSPPTPPYRFLCCPFFSRPLNPGNMAAAAPAFLPHCSQFIVEFAGDFLTQDPNPASPTFGQAQKPVPDGQIDFVVDNGVKKIRWYGLPRSLHPGQQLLGASPNNGMDLVDVVPLHDLRMACTTPPSAMVPPLTPNATFEQEWPTPIAVGGEYSSYSTATNATPCIMCNQAVPVSPGFGTGYYYTCAFGPNDPKPQMIRITITLDDPAGRLPNGQTIQYVFTLP